MPLNPEAAVRHAAGSADYLRAAFEASPLPMAVGAERRLIAVNPAFERLLGYAARDLVGRSTRQLFPSAAEYERVGATYLAACARGEACHLETELVAREGRRISCLFHVHAIDPNDLSRGVVGIVEDVTERKRAQEMLRQSRERLAFLIQATPVVIYTARPDDLRATFVSDNVAAQTGYAAAQFTGEPDFWARHIHPEDAPRVMAEFGRLGERGELLIEYRYRVGDGSYRWMRDGARLVRDAHGTPAEIVGYFLDVTEHRRAVDLAAEQAERIAAQAALLEDSNRFKSEFIARMSHELRTPLNTVLGFAELIEHMTDDPALIRAHAREIHGAGERLRLLVNDMLALAEIEASRAPFAAEPLAPLRLAEAAVRAAQPLAEGRGVALRVVVPPRLPELAGDERKLRLALGHLLANAIKHSPPGAAVTLAARAGDGTAVEFSVEDRGAGISAQDQAKLFRPFVQLEPALTRRHGGSGLGLALVARIAALHEGSAAVHSEPGQGSVFTLRIPLAHKEA